MKLEFSRLFFEKYSDIKLHENPSSCSTRRDGRTDMTKLTDYFRNLPKKASKWRPNARPRAMCDSYFNPHAYTKQPATSDNCLRNMTAIAALCGRAKKRQISVW